MEKGEAGRVFISYRRQDAAWPARQLYDVLVAELGAKRVFKDVDDIEPGDDFVEQLQSAVGSCDVLLALIGPQWLTITDAKGTRRLDDPGDFVRIEVETALNRDDVRVIPILVDNARMPTPEELPQGLAALSRRQAVKIDPTNFDTRRLLGVLHGAAVRTGTDRRRTARLVAIAISIVALVGVGVAGWYVMGEIGQGTGTINRDSSASASRPPAVSTPSSSSSSNTSTVDSPTGSNILAHRGGDEKYPLQTLESLTSAADDGFAVETDVRWTSDNRAVIIHDEAATRGLRCDQPYRVSQTTWKVLSEHCRSFVKNGKSYPPATYASVMEGLASSPSWVYVEVKTDQDAAQNKEFIDVIESNGLSDRTVVTSTDLDRLAQIKKLAPELPRMLFVSEKVPVSQLVDAEVWAVAVKYDVAAKDYISELKKAGIVVVVWTVNEARGWSKARSAGADKVLTDKPRAYETWLGKQ
jgi:glycerophosphoryl diester phosphodiesterase